MRKTFTENQDTQRHLLDPSWRYGLENIFLGIKLFCFSRQKAETFRICLKLNFVKPHRISAYSDNCHFYFFYWLSDGVEILGGFTKFFFIQMLKVSPLCLEKKLYSKKKKKIKPFSISKQESFVYCLFSVKVLF